MLLHFNLVYLIFTVDPSAVEIVQIHLNLNYSCMHAVVSLITLDQIYKLILIYKKNKIKQNIQFCKFLFINEKCEINLYILIII